MIHSQVGPDADELVRKFLEICQVADYPKNSSIVSPGDGGDSLFYVLKGSLKVTLPATNRRQYEIAYLRPGDFIGEVGLFFGANPRRVLIQSRTPCTLAKVPYSTLWNALDNELQDQAVAFLKLIGIKLSTRLMHSDRRILNLTSQDLKGRISHTLFSLCDEPLSVSHPDGTKLTISRAELSRLAGCSRERAGKALKLLEEEGMITLEGRSVIVRHQDNPNQLHR